MLRGGLRYIVVQQVLTDEPRCALLIVFWIQWLHPILRDHHCSRYWGTFYLVLR